MRRTLTVLVVVALAFQVARPLHAQAPTRDAAGTLEVYFIDTEGGQATLLVTPARESMLIDTGFAGGRDTDRITATLKLAGVSVLDYVVITHYHGDHVGGAAELAAKVPIRHFIDHGPYTVELQPNRVGGFAAYKPVRDMARAIVAKPGDAIPLQGLDVQIVTSAGQLISSNIGGAPERVCRILCAVTHA